MPAYTDEPLRGRAVYRGENLTGDPIVALDGNFDGFTAPPALAAAGEGTIWENNAGGELTLNIRSTLAAGIQNPTSFTVRVYDLSGGLVGSAALAIHGEGTSLNQTATVRLTSAPFGAGGANRQGMLEIHLEMVSAGGLDPWTVNTRGTALDPPTSAAGTQRWGRGYVRSKGTVAVHSLSNVGYGGAVPAKLAYPDSVFSDLAMAPSWRGGQQTTHRLRRGAGGAIVREKTAPISNSATANQATFASVPTTAVDRRIDSVAGSGLSTFEAAEAAIDFDLVYTALGNFGGDLEFAFQTVAPAGWTRINDQTLRRSAAGTVDPRLTLDRHLQVNDNAYGTPPSSKLLASFARQTSDLGFVSARARNSRGEGVLAASGLQLAYSLRDNGNLVAAITQAATTVAPAGGQEGWGPLRVWDSALPGGGWTNTVTATDAAGTQGSVAHAFTLLSLNPNYELVVGAGVVAAPPDHFSPGETLTIGLCLRNRVTGKYAPIDVNPAPSVTVLRYNTTTGKGQYLAADGITWTDLIVAGVEAAAYQHPLTQQTATDPNLWLTSFANTAGWGHLDLFCIGVAYSNETPYIDHSEVAALGSFNRHSKLAFDPTGLFS